MKYSAGKITNTKKILFSDRPLPKNYINPAIGEELRPLEFGSIETALKCLNKEVENFFTFFENKKDAKLINPTYGELNFDEWIQLHNRHFDHHLSQFGLLPE